VGERGCLDVLQGRPVTFGAAKQNSDESKGFLYAENSGNRPRWNLLGSVGPAGVVCLVIPLQGKEEEGLMVLRSRDKPLLKCFDPETGANKWSCEIGDGNDRDQPLSSAVVVDQASQHAYVLAAQNLASINTSSGKLDWVVDREQLRKEAAKKKNDDPTATYYFAGAITYHDNLLFVPCTDKRMRALDSSTGKELWAFPCRRDAGVATVHQGMVMFGSVDRYLYCVDAKTGALNWRVFVDGRVLGKVTVVNGMIYAPTQDGRVVVIRIPLR
jgi:outer membrane protein assembly factor BamB